MAAGGIRWKPVGSRAPFGAQTSPARARWGASGVIMCQKVYSGLGLRVWGRKSAKYSKVSEIFQIGFCKVFKANCFETMYPMILEAFLKGTPRQKNRKWSIPYPKWKWMKKFLVPWRGYCFVFLHFYDFRRIQNGINLAIALCAGFAFVFGCFLILE